MGKSGSEKEKSFASKSQGECLQNEQEHLNGEQEGYKSKWYFSFPVLMILLVFCFPVSMILSLLRLRESKKQGKRYRIRSFLALGMNAALILMMIYSTTMSGKWLSNYERSMESGDYSQAKDILDGHYRNSITREGVGYYIEVLRSLGEYDDLGRVVQSYYDSLENKTEFDLEIIGEIDKLRDKLSPEQEEKIDRIWKNIEDAKNKKMEEESKVVAESESKKAAEKEFEEEEAKQKESEELESRKAQEQESAEQEEKDKKEIHEAIAAYIENPKNKYIKELEKKESSLVWDILKSEYIKAAVETRDTYSLKAQSDIKKYCEMYREAFPESNSEADYVLKSIQDMGNLETQVQNIKGKYDYDLRSGIESMGSYEWYVQNRLETQYGDTISGAIMKEIDSYQKGDDSEWVAYNVEYYWGTAMPGENAVVLHSNELNPFTQSGAYTLNCVLSSQKRTLVNSSGFQWEAEVYEIISDPEALIGDYNRMLELEDQTEELWNQIDSMLGLLPEHSSSEESEVNTEIGSNRSEKIYSIPLDDIFPSDRTQIVSWHSELTGYYMIPELFNDTEPVIYFSTENNTITASIVYGVLVDSVEQNEQGGVICTGRMYLYTRSFGTGEEEEINGVVEVTWSSLESMDFPSIRMIDGNQMTDVSMIADDYSYYGLVE